MRATRYKEQRLVAFSNWPTTDPFKYSVVTTVYQKEERGDQRGAYTAHGRVYIRIFRFVPCLSLLSGLSGNGASGGAVYKGRPQEDL